MVYLPDTNACVHYLRQPNSLVARRLLAVRPGEMTLCDIVVAELFYGAHRSAKVTENLAQVRRFCALFPSLPFDGQAAEIYGRLRRELESVGTPIGSNDLFIASIALAHGLTLVTHNVREFSRVPNLHYEDWETP
jgi:tRNA(fMet)-specific endonuclease VapC